MLQLLLILFGLAFPNGNTFSTFGDGNKIPVETQNNSDNDPGGDQGHVPPTVD